MVETNILYQGNLRTKAIHQPSGAIIITDAPKDNHGKGESFSPTDLVATALGSCMLTVMGIAARTLEIDLEGAEINVQKEMTPPPRQIAKLAVKINIPVKVTAEQKEKLEKAALNCPVHKSLHPDVAMPIEFNWA